MANEKTPTFDQLCNFITHSLTHSLTQWQTFAFVGLALCGPAKNVIEGGSVDQQTDEGMETLELALSFSYKVVFVHDNAEVGLLFCITVTFN